MQYGLKFSCSVDGGNRQGSGMACKVIIVDLSLLS